MQSRCLPQGTADASAQVTWGDKEQLHKRWARHEQHAEQLGLVLVYGNKGSLSDRSRELLCSGVSEEFLLGGRLPVWRYMLYEASLNKLCDGR